MIEASSFKGVVARKPHKCSRCRGEIAAGERYAKETYLANTFPAVFRNRPLHVNCIPDKDDRDSLLYASGRPRPNRSSLEQASLDGKRQPSSTSKNPCCEVALPSSDVCTAMNIVPMVAARNLAIEASRLAGVMVDKRSYTTAEIKAARKVLFQAVELLDTYILVPPGKYKKVKP